jgi:hypothetical protein
MRDVTDLLSSDVPLEMFQVYSTGAFFESPMTKQFWSDIVTAHQDRLIRFSVHRMLISLESIEDICKRCTRLEQLFVVVEPNSLVCGFVTLNDECELTDFVDVGKAQ